LAPAFQLTVSVLSKLNSFYKHVQLLRHAIFVAIGTDREALSGKSSDVPWRGDENE